MVLNDSLQLINIGQLESMYMQYLNAERLWRMC